MAPWIAAHQASLSFTISQSFLKLMSIVSVMHPTISPSSPPSPLALNLPQHQDTFQWVSSLVLEFQLHHQPFQWIFRINFLLDWLVWSPSSPRDSQESSPAPQFESINSSALSLLYGPILTSIHDHWNNHSFDCIDLSRCTLLRRSSGWLSSAYLSVEFSGTLLCNHHYDLSPELFSFYHKLKLHIH